jgi:hypothetical protein
MKALQIRSMFLGGLIVALVAALALVGVRVWAQEGDGAAPDAVAEVTATTLRLTYQGRLLIPGTGQPRPDGSYGLTFRLYNVESGGTALWTEERKGANAVPVTKGAFSVELGSVTALPAIFNGQDLWLGVTGTTQAGDDPEMTPRQRITWQPYALNADRLDNYHASSFSLTSHSHSVKSDALQCRFHFRVDLIDTGERVAEGFMPPVPSLDYSVGLADAGFKDGTYLLEIKSVSYDPRAYATFVTPLPDLDYKCDFVMVMTGEYAETVTIQFLRPHL